MLIQVLGCYGGESPQCRPVSLLINGTVLLDAGAITSALPLKDQAKLNAILISHTHLDHIQDIGFLADNIFGKRDQPVRIYGTRTSLRYLKDHVLNNHIWPDFTAIPNARSPVLAYQEIQPGKEFKVEDLTVKAVKVDHIVPTVGYLVSDASSSLVYSADTGPTKNLWKEAGKLKNLKAVFVEASFPNELRRLAQMTGHLTPELLVKEIHKIGKNNFATYALHMKPAFLEVLAQECKSQGEKIHVLKQGERIRL
ncbi:MAG: hypothetical protein A2V67_07605 [Deltaproteobacteria bacterium RBG_13_61_14]|nr:MAG: hypothetical protein A2V67_07605 [Deltaproteobacteria bacterium RBG_13_61_14]